MADYFFTFKDQNGQVTAGIHKIYGVAIYDPCNQFDSKGKFHFYVGNKAKVLLLTEHELNKDFRECQAEELRECVRDYFQQRAAIEERERARAEQKEQEKRKQQEQEEKERARVAIEERERARAAIEEREGARAEQKEQEKRKQREQEEKEREDKRRKNTPDYQKCKLCKNTMTPGEWKARNGFCEECAHKLKRKGKSSPASFKYNQLTTPPGHIWKDDEDGNRRWI